MSNLPPIFEEILSTTIRQATTPRAIPRTNPLAVFVAAKRDGTDMLLAYFQRPNYVGPELRIIRGSLGYAGWWCADLVQHGGVLLGLWDTVGYDWLAGRQTAREAA
jgi:hypothetical protein